MTRQFQKTFYATAFSAAVAAMVAAPAVMAEEGGQSGGQDSSSGMSINKDVNVNVDLGVKGDIEYDGYIWADGMAEAVTDTAQNVTSNKVTNDRNNNNAAVGDNAMRGATGNIGANVAAGDNNAQANSTSISAIDAASFVFGSAMSHTFADQKAGGNTTANTGAHNAARLGNSALLGASGNVGVNIAAGTNNGQQNATSISLGNNNLAEATTSTTQDASGSITRNNPSVTTESRSVEVSLDFDGVSGEYTGVADQRGNQYLDTWGGALPHSNGSSTGHIDVDDEVQNAQDVAGVGDEYDDGAGAFVFDTAGDTQLSGTATGSMSYTVTVANRRTVNNATVDSSALRGASGNISVNVASGTNNLQSNSLAIAVVAPTSATGGAGGPEQ